MPEEVNTWTWWTARTTKKKKEKGIAFLPWQYPIPPDFPFALTPLHAMHRQKPEVNDMHIMISYSENQGRQK